MSDYPTTIDGVQRRLKALESMISDREYEIEELQREVSGYEDEQHDLLKLLEVAKTDEQLDAVITAEMEEERERVRMHSLLKQRYGTARVATIADYWQPDGER